MSMNELAGLLSNQGKYVEAEQMHRRTLELGRRCRAQSTHIRSRA
jgi:hypothetical protein